MEKAKRGEWRVEGGIEGIVILEVESTWEARADGVGGGGGKVLIIIIII